jgi:hypothetical protein
MRDHGTVVRAELFLKFEISSRNPGGLAPKRRTIRVNGKRNDEARLLTKHVPFWRGSLYEESRWVSWAWVMGPLLTAGLALYFFVR